MQSGGVVSGQRARTRSIFQAPIVAVLLLLAEPAPAGASPPVLSDGASAEQLFPAGFYTYSMPQVTWDSVTLRSHLRYMADLGFDVVHVNSLQLTDRSDITVLDLAKQSGLQVLYQMDDAYYPSSPQRIADAAADIQASAGGVLAYSVKEEPAAAQIPDLFQYYSAVHAASGVSAVPFYLLQDQVSAAAAVYNGYTTNPDLPQITGADLYPFTWNFFNNGSGYIVTPGKAFALLSSPDSGWPAFVAQTDFTQQTFFAVLTGSTERDSATLPQLQAWASAGACTAAPDACYSRWITLAQQNNQGLSYVQDPNGDYVRYWSYYRPPPGAMRAQAWLAVAAGAHGVLAWSAEPDSKPQHRVVPTITSLFGADGSAHRTVLELAQVARDLKPFGWLINNMQRDPSADGAIAVSTPADPSLAAEVIARAYAVPGVPGRVIVLVNTHVGTWSGNSAMFLSLTPPFDSFHIDESGEIAAADFVPAASLRVNLAAGMPGSVFDLQTGAALGDADGNGLPDIDLPAGGGRLLYVGGSTDTSQLLQLIGVTRTFPIAGRALLNADQRAALETRLIAPAQPVSTDVNIVLGTYGLNPGGRYRLDLTVAAQGSGVQANVYNPGASGGSAGQQTLATWSPGSSSPQTFSREFTTAASATSASLVLTRVGTGSVTIEDAWLRSLDYEERLTDPALSTVLQDTRRPYQVTVTARALPGEATTFGVKWYNCYDAACSPGQLDGGHDLITSGTPLSSTNQTFTSPIFQSADARAMRLLVVIYKANQQVAPGNTLVLENAVAWAVN
jgi:hypothetical protein